MNCYVTDRDLPSHRADNGAREKAYEIDWARSILCFRSRDQHLCKFIGAKESVYIRKEFNSHRTGLGHKHGRRFIVLGHKYGRRDVM